MKANKTSCFQTLKKNQHIDPLPGEDLHKTKKN